MGVDGETDRLQRLNLALALIKGMLSALEGKGVYSVQFFLGGIGRGRILNQPAVGMLLDQPARGKGIAVPVKSVEHGI